MAATWRISDGSDGIGWDEGYTLAEQGITDLKIRYCNHADDVATWIAEGNDLANAPFWEHGAAIKIWKDAECVFCGVISSLPRYGTGTGQRHQFEARGGWYWLTKGFYTQSYKVHNADGTTGDCSKTRVIIGYGASGPATPNAQLAEIVNQCAARGGKIAPVTHGAWDDGDHNIDVATVWIPGDEQVDLTWADAVNRILRWFPDTSVWFTYDTGMPVCWMVRRSALPNRVNDIAVLEEVDVTPRHDLVVSGVRIDYEIVTEVADQADETQTHRYRKVVSRTAGNASALGAAHFTVELDGGTETRLRQKIQTENLPATASGAGSVWQDFFRKYIPELEGKVLDSFTCNNQTWFPRTGTGVTLPRVLLRGEVQPWMNRAAQETRLEFSASYHDQDNQWIDRTFCVTLTLTNAATGTYTAKTRTAGEDVPDGLAAQVFAAVGSLYWEGRIARIGEDPPDIGMPGELIDLSGGRPEWYRHTTAGGVSYDGMLSPVQSTEWDVGAAKTTVAFGPPAHLGLQDLIELAQANRKRQAVKSQGTKASADEDDDPDDGMTIGGAGPNTHGGETEGTPARRTLVGTNPQRGQSISIDADEAIGSAESPYYDVATGSRTSIYAGAIHLVNPTRGDVVLPGKFSTTSHISNLLTDGEFLVIRGAPTMSGRTEDGHWTESVQPAWIPPTLTVGGQIPVATLCVRGGIVLGVINPTFLDFTAVTINLPIGPTDDPRDEE